MTPAIGRAIFARSADDLEKFGHTERRAQRTREPVCQGDAMTAEFGLLGEIRATVDGREVGLGGARQRGLLAALLVDANRAVSTDQLLDRAWGGARLPERPANAVQSQVTLLRRALTCVAGVSISCRSAGYRLTVAPEAVDLCQFRELTLQTVASDGRTTESLLERALGLWRGRACAGLDTPWFTTLRDTLERERHAVWLDLTDARLRRGQHAGVLAELADGVGRYPLDERLAGQFMLALYRSGRPADALAHYRGMRQRLATELGIDLGPQLCDLHQQILTSDSRLAVPAPAVEVRDATLVPHQLPATPRVFTGRDTELGSLTALLNDGDGPAVCALAGTGGIGKTWLALHWAHQNVDRFPDGQLFVDLRGFSSVGEPLTHESVLRGFLGALGVSVDRIPLDLHAQAGLYRSLVADRRMLIVLDNAFDAAQVTPLLPGSASCTVLLTSRRQLISMLARHGGRQLRVGVLAREEARRLMTSQLGGRRVRAEPDAVDELLARCAGFPLALGIVIARGLAAPDLPLADLAEELRDENTRLDALSNDDPDASLPAVMSWSVRGLGDDQVTVFALLGLVPESDIGPTAAASLVGEPAGGILRALEQASMVERVAGRYRIHDLVRLSASEQADRRLSAVERAAAVRRLVEYYLHTAHSGERCLNSHRESIELWSPVTGCRPDMLVNGASAWAWFDAEHANVLAAQRESMLFGWHDVVWHLARVLTPYHYHKALRSDAVAVWRAGLCAAEYLPEPSAAIVAHQNLGFALSQIGAAAEGMEYLREALALAEVADDPVARMHTNRLLAVACGQHCDSDEALAYARNAVSLARELDNPVWYALTLNTAGRLAGQTGRYAEGLSHCGHGLALCRAHGNRRGEGNALDLLGYLKHQAGEHAEAARYYEESLALRRVLSVRYDVAATLDGLGLARLALGESNRARVAWSEALELDRADGRKTAAERVRRQLDAVNDIERRPAS